MKVKTPLPSQLYRLSGISDGINKYLTTPAADARGSGRGDAPLLKVLIPCLRVVSSPQQKQCFMVLQYILAALCTSGKLKRKALLPAAFFKAPHKLITKASCEML